MADALRTEGQPPAFPLPDTLARRMRAVTRILPQAEMEPLAFPPTDGTADDAPATATETVNIEAMAPPPAPSGDPLAEAPVAADSAPAPKPPAAPEDLGKALSLIKSMVEEQDPEDFVVAEPEPEPEPDPRPAAALDDRWAILREPIDEEDDEDDAGLSGAAPEVCQAAPDEEDTEAEDAERRAEVADPAAKDHLRSADPAPVDGAPAPQPAIGMAQTEAGYDDDYWGADTPTHQALLDAFADVAHLNPAPPDAPSTGLASAPLDTLILQDEPAAPAPKKRGLMGWMRRG